MKNSIWKTVPVSVVIHAAAIYMIFAPDWPPLEDRLEDIQVDLIERSDSSKPSREGRKGRGRETLEDPGLSRFARRYSFRSGQLSEVDDWGSGGSEGQTAWGGKGDYMSETEYQAQYLRVMEAIKGMLSFPAALGQRDMQGVVNARLVFDGDSHCDWSRSWIKGANRYLSFYSLGVLKKACTLEAVQRQNFKRGQYLDISFSFLITEGVHSTEEQESLDRVLGNVILFRRTFAKSNLQYQLGPLRGIWIVPSVQIDPMWFVEKWDQYMNGRDPLREFQEAG